MLLSRTAIYALRLLAVLTEREGDERATANSLGERTGVPRPYLSKVLRQLAAAGIIDGVRGHGGGFRMAKPARSVRVRDVLEAVNADLDLGQCAFREGPCDLGAPCVLHGIVGDIQDEIARWADRKTLADVGRR